MKEVLTNKLRDTTDYKDNYLDENGQVKNQEEADKWVNDNVEKFEKSINDIKSQYNNKEETKEESISDEDSK